MGSRENFSLLDKFAYKVGGVVAGSEQLLKRDGYPLIVLLVKQERRYGHLYITHVALAVQYSI